MQQYKLILSEQYWKSYEERNMNNCNLSNMDLSQLDLAYVSIENVNFNNSILPPNLFEQDSLPKLIIGCSFDNCNIEIKKNPPVGFYKCSFKNAKMRINHAFPSYKIMAMCDFENADLSEMTFCGADISGSNFTGSDISSLDLQRIYDRSIQGCKFKNQDLNTKNFRQVDISYAEFENCELAKSNLSEARLNTRVKFQECKLPLNIILKEK